MTVTTQAFSLTNPKAERFHHVMSFTVIIKDGTYYKLLEQCDFTNIRKTTKEKARESYSHYIKSGFIKSEPCFVDIKDLGCGRVQAVSNRSRV